MRLDWGRDEGREQQQAEEADSSVSVASLAINSCTPLLLATLCETALLCVVCVCACVCVLEPVERRSACGKRWQQKQKHHPQTRSAQPRPYEAHGGGVDLSFAINVQKLFCMPELGRDFRCSSSSAPARGSKGPCATRSQPVVSRIQTATPVLRCN